MKRALGIEIGRAFAAVCEVKVEGDGPPRRQRSACHEFPDEQYPSPEELADACLRQTLEAGIRSRSAVLALARSLTYTKAVQLPPIPADERLRLVSLQPERFFPVSDRALVCDLEPGVNGSPPVAHATESDKLEALIEALQSRGFRISAVLPASAALLRAATRGVPGLAQVNWLLVRPEGSGLTTHAYQSRSLRVSRRMDSLEADPAGVLREISRTAVNSFEEGATVSEVRWSGWREVSEPVKKIAADLLQLPVHDLSEVPVSGAALGAYGAALAALEEAPRPDLMPAVVRARRRQQARWITLACAALTLLGGMALLWALGERQDTRLRRLNSVVAEARTGAMAAADARDQVQVLEDRIAAVQRRMEERASWIRLLNEISTALPGTAWIGSLNVESGGAVGLSGYATAASSLIPALQGTAALDEVEFAAPTTRAQVGARELEAFNIRAVLEGSSADSLAAIAGTAGVGGTQQDLMDEGDEEDE